MLLEWLETGDYELKKRRSTFDEMGDYRPAVMTCTRNDSVVLAWIRFRRKAAALA